eukprot:m51a1_g13849 putative kinesin-like protein kif3b (728) ;mRNA; r:565963-568790
MGKGAAAPGGECVKVVVRCRPLNSKEIEMKDKCVVVMEKDSGKVHIGEGNDTKTFMFDKVYDWNCQQINVYEECVAPIVESILEGYNGTVFAYGQTGSGKTWTMEGKRTPELQGVMPNSFEHIFYKISEDKETTYLVTASYLEIYNEEVRDLLSANPKIKLELHDKRLPNGEDEVYVKGLSCVAAKSELEKILTVGQKNRAIGRTDMNLVSSRSHSIFTVCVEMRKAGMDGKDHIRRGKLNLVDLAGSERLGKTNAEGTRKEEGININLSLMALGGVISALVEGNTKHIPYRDSKLTRLLQNSLGGSCKTVMIANFSPASFNYNESVGTLRYADRAKRIKNTPKINEDPKDALLREYEAEIKRLRDMVAARKGLGASGSPAPLGASSAGGEQVAGVPEELMEQLKKEKEEEIAKILKDKGFAEEEAIRIQGQMHEVAEKAKRERRERSQLELQLKAMEEKLVGGPKTLIDENQRQKAMLVQQHMRMEQERAERQRLEQQREEERSRKLELELKVGDVQKQRDVVSRKLKELFEIYRRGKQEMVDIQDDFQREREGLLDHVRSLRREIRLRNLVMRSFIPAEEVAKSRRRAVFDEEKRSWHMRPLTPEDLQLEITTHGQGVPRIRHRERGEVIRSLALDMPDRTTQEYESIAEARAMMAQVQAALSDEEDEHVVLRSAENLPVMFLGDDKSLLASSPSSRGLVTRSLSGGAMHRRSASPSTLRKTIRL